MSNYCWGIIANELKGRGTAVETLSSSRPRRFRLQPQLLTGGQVVVHRLAFVVDQRTDEEQPAEQAAVLGAGFDGAVIALTKSALPP